MLRHQLRALAVFAVGAFVIGWGGFYLLTLPDGHIPRELLWLGVVLAVGVSLATITYAVLKARSRRADE
jgi:hypothetical protein